MANSLFNCLAQIVDLHGVDLDSPAGRYYALNRAASRIKDEQEALKQELVGELTEGELLEVGNGIALRCAVRRTRQYPTEAITELEALGLLKHLVKPSDAALKKLVDKKLLSRSTFLALQEQADVVESTYLTETVLNEALEESTGDY